MPRRILVVDDYADSRDMLDLIFQQAGFLVGVAVNGVEALSAARHQRPDAVVMDLFMPVMDGFEATRQMKADPNLKDVPVIAYSGKAASADEHDYLFTAICQKPCPPEQLVDLVKAAVENTPPNDTAPTA